MATVRPVSPPPTRTQRGAKTVCGFAPEEQSQPKALPRVCLTAAPLSLRRCRSALERWQPIPLFFVRAPLGNLVKTHRCILTISLLRRRRGAARHSKAGRVYPNLSRPRQFSLVGWMPTNRICPFRRARDGFEGTALPPGGRCVPHSQLTASTLTRWNWPRAGRAPLGKVKITLTKHPVGAWTGETTFRCGCLYPISGRLSPAKGANRRRGKIKGFLIFH